LSHHWASAVFGQFYKLPFARWANGKRIKENRPGVRSPFSPHVSMSELTENGNTRLFAANGKRKRQTFVCLQKNGKRKFVFLGRQTINGNRRLLFSTNLPHRCCFWSLLVIF
jgi:hypothetical protein